MRASPWSLSLPFHLICGHTGEATYSHTNNKKSSKFNRSASMHRFSALEHWVTIHKTRDICIRRSRVPPPEIYPHDRKGGGLVVCSINFWRNSLIFWEI